MKSMTYTTLIRFLSLFLFLGLRWTIALADEIEGIQFGSFINPSDDAWHELSFQPELPSEPFYAKVLALGSFEETVIFYHDTEWNALLLLPKNDVLQLHVLEGQNFVDEHSFLEAVESRIGKQYTVEYHDMLVKYLEPEPCSIYVWSRREQAGEVTYQIIHYRVDGQELLVVEENSGNYQTTAERLHAVLQHRQEHGEAPAPILLNFLKKPQEYLCDEEEWFRYLKGWE